MTTTTRTAALGALAALMLAFGIMPRSVMAHSNHQVSFTVGQLTGAWYDSHDDRVEPFFCGSSTGVTADSAHADPTHKHQVRIIVSTTAGVYVVAKYVNRRRPSTFEVIAGQGRALEWQTAYTLQLQMHVTGRWVNVGNPITANLGAKPQGVETQLDVFCRTGTPTTPTPPATPPTTPTTPTHSHPLPSHTHRYAATSHVHDSRPHSHSDLKHAHPFAAQEHTHTYAAVDHTHEAPAAPAPETPEPAAQTCTYKHRLIGVPGASAYSGRILISSELPNATATIRAYQSDNGHRIDVLDADGRDVETVSLDPANSVKRFTIEAAQGWHPVIVTHPSESAMQAATVAMRYRDGGSLEDSYPPGIEHCEPESTGPVTVTDTPTEPETPSPPEPETPAPPEPETPDPVTPEPEPETPEPPAQTAPELAVNLTAAVRDAGKVTVSGTVTNAGTTASAPTRIRFLNGRRRVHTATVPAIGGGAVHTIRADVAMPEGDAVQVCIVPKGRDADPSNDCDTASVTTGQ